MKKSQLIKLVEKVMTENSNSVKGREVILYLKNNVFSKLTDQEILELLTFLNNWTTKQMKRYTEKLF